MSYTITKEKNKAVFTLTIPKEEVEEGMKHAAEHFAEESKIPGFRPGKAPYEVVKQRVGEMKLLEACAEELIRNAFVKAMIAEDLETVGQPFFETVKFAPGNDLVITAEIALYPHVKSLADYRTLSVEKKATEPAAEAIEQAKKDLTLMQTKEVRAPKDTELKSGDKAVVNLTMKKGGVVLEGGEGKNHGIYTAEGHYIEGLVDKILGAKEGEARSFTLPFPKDHYQKHLAGENVDFDVTVNEIYHLEAPALDDEFAKSLGLKDAKDLEEKLAANLRLEAEREEDTRQEKAILDLICEKSDFEEIPDLLLNQEITKMLHELEHSLSMRTLSMEQYLKDIGKSMDELKLDFTPTALMRIKAAIVLKEVVKKEDIQLEEGAVDAELDNIAKAYEGNAEAQKKVFEPEYREYVEHQLTNRKALAFLKGLMVK